MRVIVNRALAVAADAEQTGVLAGAVVEEGADASPAATRASRSASPDGHAGPHASASGEIETAQPFADELYLERFGPVGGAGEREMRRQAERVRSRLDRKRLKGFERRARVGQEVGVAEARDEIALPCGDRPRAEMLALRDRAAPHPHERGVRALRQSCSSATGAPLRSRNTACSPNRFHTHQGTLTRTGWLPALSAMARSILASTARQRATKSRIVQK